MILKLLLLIVVITTVYLLFFKKKSIKKPTKTSRSKKTDSEEMVACSKCGTYVPVDETFIKDAKYYCSQECMND